MTLPRTYLSSEGPEADSAGGGCITHRKGSTEVRHFCHLWAFPRLNLAGQRCEPAFTAAQNSPEPPKLPGTARVNHSQMLCMCCDMQENSDFALYSKNKDGRAFPLLIYSQ